MRQLSAIERRLQNLERAIENAERYGEIVDTKFDQEKKRWYVKINDGEDKTPSGQDGQSGEFSQTFKSAWLPWKSFAHGTISASIPPRKGMKAMLRTPAGAPQMATAEPYHFSTENESPHDKEDEIFLKVKRPKQDNENARSAQGDEKDETLDILLTKDNAQVTIGGTTFNVTKDKVTIKTGTIEIESEKFIAKTGSVEWING